MNRASRIAVPLLKPEDVIPHLGKPTHWKQGRSAKAVADSWFYAKDIPPVVRALLSQSPELAEAELLDGWLERQTDLNDRRGSPTQTDLLAILGLEEELAILGIEAKVDESFGPFVGEWKSDRSPGKLDRLAKLCELLRIEPATIDELRYQLFHRTAAVILEAQRFRSKTAVLIVQSFCPKATGLPDFITFMKMLGFQDIGAGKLSGPISVNAINLWVGWAADLPRTEASG